LSLTLIMGFAPNILAIESSKESVNMQDSVSVSKKGEKEPTTKEGMKLADSVKAEKMSKSMSPKKQFAQGVPASQVTCADHLQLVIKAKDGSPACVMPDHIPRLVETGWATKTS